MLTDERRKYAKSAEQNKGRKMKIQNVVVYDIQWEADEGDEKVIKDYPREVTVSLEDIKSKFDVDIDNLDDVDALLIFDAAVDWVADEYGWFIQNAYYCFE